MDWEVGDLLLFLSSNRFLNLRCSRHGNKAGDSRFSWGKLRVGEDLGWWDHLAGTITYKAR